MKHWIAIITIMIMGDCEVSQYKDSAIVLAYGLS